jgi:hypothetical protein
MERYSINRGVSVQEVSPHVYELVRYDSYTNELGAVNLPTVPTDPYPEPSLGLHYFRGGYEWIVDDTVKADLIASGIGIDNSNFVPAP